ncbi:acyl-CoA dehydratase activase [Calderihabitans maritimus]|uniref:Putative CoA-substrate-specific enzyme activase n=1 Tax=Calderihabitans maritimus TaxID=1246530 RepID=A0A1Z5HTW2_9FIRM|nr:acyl-CoA dehydratase activase [Calderihabitans maritimus]GAW92964.1 putative CoA-substrate-specific enzyme activase [Calderihabitans maritimus]
MRFAGIDVGSLTAKVVIIDEQGEIVGYEVIPTGIGGKEAARRVMDRILERLGLSYEDIYFTVATGYGRVSVPFKDKQVTEITCHARGAHWLFSDARLVIDIGGQDSKIIKLGKGGMVIDFAMNDKCAAGTGRFLEVMANALEVKVDDLAELAAQSKNHIEISSTCTVFAESEVISRIAEGTSRADIVAGIHRAVASRVYALLRSKTAEKYVEGSIVMTGGVAKNKGMVNALEEKIGVSIRVPEEPQIVGALGAAVIARENYRSNQVTVKNKS